MDLFESLEIKKINLYNGLGFVEIVDLMPRIVPIGRSADIAISRNARVSYAQGDKSISEDSNLVRYLMKNYHTSPSESVVFQFRMRIPIFVERQLIRHRTARVNEQSFRYTIPKDEFYYPSLRQQSQTNKQGSSDEESSEESKQIWESVDVKTKEMFELYKSLINNGVAKEVARVCLPVSLMTELMWQMDLHNLMNFLRLRMDTHAQLEIQDLAKEIYELIKPIVPVSMKAFEEFRLN